MAQKGFLSKLSIQVNSKSNSESMEETPERGRRNESSTFCAMVIDAHIRPINATYQVENNTNDQLSPVTRQTKNLNTIDENDHMSPVTGQTKNPNAINFSQLMAVQRQQSEMIMNLVSQLSGVTQSLAQLQKGVSENLGEEEYNSAEYSSNCTEHQSVSRTLAEASII